ncbi:MAG: hypothetical protein AAFO94_02620 [Bacteroidota bacterium]
MKRRQLFEFGDQHWLPRSLRRYLMELLSYQTGIIYQQALPVLIGALQKTKTREILDLCSGSGGPWPRLAPLLNARAPYPIHVLLSDKFPPEVFNDTDVLRYHPQPIDTLGAKQGLPKFRTLFTGFHHYKPDEARQLLQQTVEDGAHLAIFEFTSRNRQNVNSMLGAPALVWRLSRQLKPLGFFRWFWTYFIPIIPLLYTWDGWVSHWRSYSTDELRQLASGLTAGNYRWEAGEIHLPNLSDKVTQAEGAEKKSKHAHKKITYLIGYNLTALPQKKSNRLTAQSKLQAK